MKELDSAIHQVTEQAGVGNPPKEAEKVLRTLFADVDMDGKGSISKEEVAGAEEKVADRLRMAAAWVKNHPEQVKQAEAKAIEAGEQLADAAKDWVAEHPEQVKQAEA